MAICKFFDMVATLPKGQKIIGLDVGKKTIGVAIGDATHNIASPHRIIWRKKFTADMTDLLAEMEDLQVGGLVIGWPLNMDGTEGPRCDSTRDFTHALLRLKDVPISFQDERWSTQAVERSMVDADMTRKNRHIRRDALAATWILQSAFDLYHQNSLDAPAPLPV